jgi:hypothetical protein
MDGSEGGMAGAAEEVGAAVPQTWQKVEPGARLLPHFEQNIIFSWVEKRELSGRCYRKW